MNTSDTLLDTKTLAKISSRFLGVVFALLTLATTLATAPTFADPEAEAKSESYRAGKSALDEERWADAASLFKQAASEEGAPEDAALYWQGYAFHKQGRSSAALAALGDLRPERFPGSRWLDDARALEIEIRSAAGEAPSPEAESKAELKLIALFGLMEQNPTRALSYIQKMLSGSEPVEVKEKALFVLGQSDAPEARQLIAQMAQGKIHGELRRQAIHLLAMEAEDDEETMRLLDEIYQGSSDLEVKQHVLHGYMMADDAERLLAVARGGDAPELRMAAVHGLGAMDATEALRELYAKEASAEVKAQIIHSLSIADDSETLIRLARTETDPELQRHAIRSLGQVDGEDSRAALGELYRSSTDLESRRAIIHAYAMQDAASELMRIAREEKDFELRKAAIEGLTQMDAPEAEELLLEILEN